jgi:hypothetical protein
MSSALITSITPFASRFSSSAALSEPRKPVTTIVSPSPLAAPACAGASWATRETPAQCRAATVAASNL